MACNVEINKLGKNVQVFTNEFPLEIDLTNSSQIPLEPDQWSNWILPDAPTDPSLFTVRNSSGVEESLVSSSLQDRCDRRPFPSQPCDTISHSTWK